MRLPFGDWQFYAVTILALWGAWMVARPFLPSKKRSGGCPTCASGSAASTKRRKTPLTIGGKRA